MSRRISAQRETKETTIQLVLDMDYEKKPELRIEGLPFFSHLLNALSFHGNFYLSCTAAGDIDVDPHHLVEDIGLVLGDALFQTISTYGAVARFGHSVIPMDDSLSEVTVDTAGRPYLVYNAQFPQEYAGGFPLCLIGEFLTALSAKGQLTLHAACLYGKNGHHMVESLFKALGKALKEAFTHLGTEEGPQSTKGTL